MHAWLKIHPSFAFDVVSRLFHVRLTSTVTCIDCARDRLAFEIFIVHDGGAGAGWYIVSDERDS